MNVTFSREATSDLEAIADWIAQENPARAYAFVRELHDDCLNLKEFSKQNPIFNKSDLGDVRKRPYGNYVIFYTIDDSVLSIVRILHGPRDFSDLF